LSRCAYDQNLTPDPNKSQAAFPYGNPIEYCGNLPGIFRAEQVKEGFEANSLPSDYQAFSPGDVLAAAQFLKNQKGAVKIGALSGSMGGLNIIRAASIQNGADNDFDGRLLDALLAFSPVGDVNTVLYVANTNQFPCGMAERVRFYSTQIKGTGIRNFDVDREGAIEDYFMLLNGVNIVRKLKIPVFIFYTLTEYNDHPNEGMAYKSKTDTMMLGHTMIRSLLGHFGHNWRSDPYWGDKVVLTYFKLLLAHNDSQIGDDPGFPSLGPRTNNPYIIDLKVNKKDADMLLSEESIIPFILKNCFD
jgi:hypothetical protein